MSDFAAARRIMVDSQIRPSDVTDLRLIAAMLELPRERFLPASQAGLAYLDLDVPVTEPGPAGAARRLLKPMVLAKLVQAVNVGPEDHVLDVGCATGYSSALLGKLSSSVVALEQDPQLAERARALLPELGLANVTVQTAPLAEGWRPAAPYDVILVNGATEVRPEALLAQLRDGGRLVCILRRAGTGAAMLFVASGGTHSGRPVFDASAPLLPGFVAPVAFVF
jgi:protein-L-isoaspartate(D-aspartate) O-methyltransferase